jgi:hypothetical protein
MRNTGPPTPRESACAERWRLASTPGTHDAAAHYANQQAEMYAPHPLPRRTAGSSRLGHDGSYVDVG